MNRRLFIWTSVAILAAFVACTGCTGTLPSAPAAETQAADSGLLIITEEFWPYNYRNETGVIAGQSTAVVRAILARLNQTADIELMPWDEGYGKALSEPNVALYSTARTAQREEMFLWVGPIESSEMVLYKRNGSLLQIDSLEGAKRTKAIAVVRDDVRHQYLVENNATNLLLFATEEECAKSLILGEADLWLGDSETVFETAQNAGVDPAELEEAYSVRKVELFIAFNNRTPENVVAAWQGALDSMKRDGTYEAIVGAPHKPASSAGEMIPAESALSALTVLTDLRIMTVARSLEAIAITDDAKSGEWERIRPLLVGIEQHPDPSARLWYALPDGSYYTPVDGLTGSNLKDRAYFPGVLAGNTSVGTLVVSHSTGRDTVIAAVPIKNDDTVTGVLGASIYLDTMSEALKQDLMLPDDIFFFALDRDGRTALHSREERIFQDPEQQGTPTLARAIQTILLEENGTVEYEFDGRVSRLIFRTSPVTGWHFCVGWSPEA